MHVDRPGVAIAGAGNIAQQYAAELAAATEVELLGVTDLGRTRAQALADEQGCATPPTWTSCSPTGG